MAIHQGNVQRDGVKPAIPMRISLMNSHDTRSMLTVPLESRASRGSVDMSWYRQDHKTQGDNYMHSDLPNIVGVCPYLTKH